MSWEEPQHSGPVFSGPAPRGPKGQWSPTAREGRMLAGGIPRSEGVRPGREGQVAMEGLLVTGVWVAGLWGTVGRWAGHGAWSECGCCQGRGGRCGWRCGRGLAMGVVWLWAWSGECGEVWGTVGLWACAGLHRKALSDDGRASRGSRPRVGPGAGAGGRAPSSGLVLQCRPAPHPGPCPVGGLRIQEPGCMVPTGERE